MGAGYTRNRLAVILARSFFRLQFVNSPQHSLSNGGPFNITYFEQFIGSHSCLDRRVLAVVVNQHLGDAVDGGQ